MKITIDDQVFTTTPDQDAALQAESDLSNVNVQNPPTLSVYTASVIQSYLQSKTDSLAFVLRQQIAQAQMTALDGSSIADLQATKAGAVKTEPPIQVGSVKAQQ